LRKQAVPYRTRLTGRLISCNEGFDANASDPSPFWASRAAIEMVSFRGVRSTNLESGDNELRFSGAQLRTIVRL